ncbi:DNA gyrase inhibitor YacG [Enterovirga rhinocerotis]|uniref:DNA gyrase inhibitor YacG n=1 Tax=Enterovirga rhinocerotis TaxID=1339210 RepID=A0A4R7C6Y7_9HYPH|nr:DNA gyrase inhibitor YacG [Enterovirga rhinocerotis]TDR94370.1 hypothetical protein EV668_1657 [Enterovirga rhinocerotis]
MTAIALKPCPICGRPAADKTRPFCSVRCADVDLGRWLTGSYAIPVAEDEMDDDVSDDEGAGHRKMS